MLCGVVLDVGQHSPTSALCKGVALIVLVPHCSIFPLPPPPRGILGCQAQLEQCGGLELDVMGLAGTGSSMAVTDGKLGSQLEMTGPADTLP